MKPFSPLYFIKENRFRCLLLMLLLFLAYGAYLGGIYISTPQENWEYPIEMSEKYIMTSCCYDDPGGKEFEKFCEELEKHDDIRVIKKAWYQQLNRKTVMGFSDGTFCYSFRSVDDFKAFCEYFGIKCDLTNVTNKTVVMSPLMADNYGAKVGDVISPNEDDQLYYDVTFAAVTDEKGYTQYFIGDEDELNSIAMIISRGATMEQMRRYTDDAMKEHRALYSVSLKDDTAQTYESFNLIFVVVMIFLAVIMAVTVNAAFVGMYQRRELEFAVYNAIGISRRRLVGKIAGELICMDAAALTVGGAIFFTVLYIFNNIFLEPKGLYIVYFSPVALTALVICNLTTLVPLIITRSRTLLKANVCDY